MFQFNIQFFFGSICSVLLLSTLINYIFLQNIKEPKKNIISILYAYNILGATMIAFFFGRRTCIC